MWRLVTLVVAASACADPTAIEVTVYSDVPCSAQAEVALSVAGDSQTLVSAVPASVATQCDEVGDGTVRRGSVVLVPQGDKEKPIAFQVTTRDDDQPVDACSSDVKGCIEARRQLRFQSQKTVEVRVDLRLSCLGVACAPDQTCVKGTCVSAQLPSCNPCGEPDGGGAVPGPPSAVTAVPVPIGVVSTLAGSGNKAFADGTGAAASFAVPVAVAVDGAGNVYVADADNNRIRVVTSAGVVTTLAGSGAAAYADGTGVAASFSSPGGVALDGAGNLYVGDAGNNRVRKVTHAGVVTTLAGSGSPAYAEGTGTAASFDSPAGVAVDGAGNVYVADSLNNRIRKVTSAGVVTTLAGSGAGAFADGTGAAASFNFPGGATLDAAGNVYVGDSYNHRVRKVTSAGVVTTLAGSGMGGFADGTGTTASFYYVFGVAVSTAGIVYAADQSNQRIRAVTSAGVVTTLAGSGATGTMDGPGAGASFTEPCGVATDNVGTVYVADQANNLIRTVTTGMALVVTWSAPSATGGLPITGYVASAQAAAQPTRTCATSGTTCVIRGLASGVTYNVTVTASNASGTSVPSAPVSATPN